MQGGDGDERSYEGRERDAEEARGRQALAAQEALNGYAAKVQNETAALTSAVRLTSMRAACSRLMATCTAYHATRRVSFV